MSFRTTSMRMARLATAKATLSKRTFSLLANATTRYTAASSAAKAMTQSPQSVVLKPSTLVVPKKLSTKELIGQRKDY